MIGYYSTSIYRHFLLTLKAEVAACRDIFNLSTEEQFEDRNIDEGKKIPKII
jgi:hypothetical protein